MTDHLTPGPAVRAVPAAGQPHVFHLLSREAARARRRLHRTADIHAATDLFLCNVQNSNALTWYLETFRFRIHSSWTAELGWDFLDSLAARLRKSSDYSLPLLLSWMACLYGRLCHQAWCCEHSHCYCLTIVNQLKTNCAVPEKYFISCNETGLQSFIWLPDWKDYKEQWFWTSLRFFFQWLIYIQSQEEEDFVL